MDHGYNIKEWRENLSDMRLNLELSADMHLKQQQQKHKPIETNNLQLSDSALSDTELSTLLQSTEDLKETEEAQQQSQMTDEFIKHKGDQIKKE